MARQSMTPSGSPYALVKPSTRIRLLGKKRGDRSTGSRLVGSVGEAVFFGVLFLLGTISLTALITSQVLNPTPELYRPGFGFWLVVLVSASFVIIGGVGVLLTVAETGTSAERRSAMVSRAARIDLLSEALPSQHEYPQVPRDTSLADSPGIHLTYRLPMIRRNAWTLATFAGLSLSLSAFAAVLTVLFIQTFLASEPDWYALAFALPFVAAGGWSVYHFLSSIRWHSRIGATLIEISDLPLYPGKEYEFYLSQSGRCQLKSLRVEVVCEEEATYHQGTDIRTETAVVYRRELLCRESVELEANAPLEIHDLLTIPSHAMHSFQSAHNAVRWRLIVSASPVRWPSFERHFPLIIYPTKYAHHTPAPRRVDKVRVDHGTAH